MRTETDDAIDSLNDIIGTAEDDIVDMGFATTVSVFLLNERREPEQGALGTLRFGKKGQQWGFWVSHNGQVLPDKRWNETSVKIRLAVARTIPNLLQELRRASTDNVETINREVKLLREFLDTVKK